VKTTYRDREAARLENDELRVTVLREGGHIAEIADKASGVNPLWTPMWPSIEPSHYDPARHLEYGGGADASLLAGIMGHNLCLDMFGGPSDEEAAAGLPVHGEVSTARFAIDADDSHALTMRAELPEAQLAFERTLELAARALRVRERVTNRSATDRAIGWTQHVTLGPPFVEHGLTQLRTSARRGRVFEGTFGPADYLKPGADFDWPNAPRVDGGMRDLRTFSSAAASSAYTVQHMDPARDDAFVAAFSPSARLTFGCIWRRSDFPWLGLWEENRSRPNTPWNSRTMTWGLEFGASPFPETRRQMIGRGPLFDTPTVRWIPARVTVEVEYWMVLLPGDTAPDELTRPQPNL
jgi:hypothetical protein